MPPAVEAPHQAIVRIGLACFNHRMHRPIELLLRTYPRQRPALDARYRAIQDAEYFLNRRGSTFFTALSTRMESWMHRKVAEGASGGEVLEVGAGMLNHLSYERVAAYDIVEPFVSAYRDSPERAKVRNVFSDIAEIGGNQRYDRIISVAALEHLTDLPMVVACSARLLKPGGRFQAGIPTEGGALWHLAVAGTTGLGFRMRNRGRSVAPMMRHEHVNRADEIAAVVRHFFAAVEIRRFPLPAFHLSFYTYVAAREPRSENLRAFFAARGVIPQ